VRAGAVIVIAASGMCDAGRVRHHLRHNHRARRNAAVMITGFQARGQRSGGGWSTAKSACAFLATICPSRATVHTIGGLSAHADRDALLGWLRGFQTPPARTFVVHG
jgi:metallo-beta-lactamase family protein